MNDVPAGPNGEPIPSHDAPEGKPHTATYGGEAPKADWRTWARRTVLAIIAIYAILFVVKNRDTVTIDFVFFQAAVPEFVALILALIFGALLGGAAMWRLHRKRDEARAGK